MRLAQRPLQDSLRLGRRGGAHRPRPLPAEGGGAAGADTACASVQTQAGEHSSCVWSGGHSFVLRTRFGVDGGFVSGTTNVS